MARRLVMIKHEDGPADDRAATWLAAQGFALDWRAPYAGDALEAPDAGVAGTVLYGDPQGIPDIGHLPFLAEEG
jgi:hypothetical protein